MRAIINDIMLRKIHLSSSLKTKISRLIKKIRGKKIVSITFTDDEFIRRLNRMYRGKDKATDVLSFSMEEENLLGDVIISKEQAKRNTKRFNVNFENEILRLVAHGTLHLLGYDHWRKKDRVLMQKKEEELLRKVS